MDDSEKHLRRERWSLLVTIDKTLAVPMDILAFIWLILTIRELTTGLSEGLHNMVIGIWIIFGLDFFLEFLIAPQKLTYLKHNWLTALSLTVPAFRIFRIVKVLRYIRFVRGSSILRVLSSINRGMRTLRKSMGKRGLPYVSGITLIVISTGAAGIMYLERDYTDYFGDYVTALWWTSMMVTTMGSDYFPKSSEGRLLALLLAVYGFAIFGYVTASVASFFIDKKN